MIIGPLGFDAWQARMREPDGETTVSRHALRDLLDRLDEILSGNTEGLSSPPGALQPPRVPRARTAVPIEPSGRGQRAGTSAMPKSGYFPVAALNFAITSEGTRPRSLISMPWALAQSRTSVES